MYYFAYGSNMNQDDMAYRCPGAVKAGNGMLWDYTLVERQFADIDYKAGSWVDGVLWEISEDNLRSLDHYEGYPRFYNRHLADIGFDGRIVGAIVYEMTPSAKLEHDGIPYSLTYRRICSEGAIANGIEDEFKLKEEICHTLNLIFPGDQRL